MLSTTFFSWQGQERQNHIESDLLWRVVLGGHSGFSFKGVKQWGLLEGSCGGERMWSFRDVLNVRNNVDVKCLPRITHRSTLSAAHVHVTSLGVCTRPAPLGPLTNVQREARYNFDVCCCRSLTPLVFQPRPRRCQHHRQQRCHLHRQVLCLSVQYTASVVVHCLLCEWRNRVTIEF